ncbi:hypothetical protein CVD28_00140 [Bacillus sp. M6-12]|uniref:hypothetical protein n=1 Tax=Bacillus sp. M6-12 TaxID=2054166 RepID=UPI000C7803FD|nr:hypothetical protein [Bacillus sp. M6-12]PLS18845.1 hypothetical protein CVD28_00140 [Bacillus sp. M6-12]
MSKIEMLNIISYLVLALVFGYHGYNRITDGEFLWGTLFLVASAGELFWTYHHWKKAKKNKQT